MLSLPRTHQVDQAGWPESTIDPRVLTMSSALTLQASATIPSSSDIGSSNLEVDCTYSGSQFEQIHDADLPDMLRIQ